MRPVYKKPRIKKVKPPRPVPPPKPERPKRGDLKHIYKELISTSIDQRVNALAKAMAWYDTVQVYLSYKKSLSTNQLRTVNRALAARHEGIKAKTPERKEQKFTQAINHYQVAVNGYKPPRISQFLRKFRSSKSSLNEHLHSMRKKYKKFLDQLQDALSPGMKLSVEKLASKYRIGRREVVLDRRWVADLKKMSHRQGLLSAVIELLPVLSEAMTGDHGPAHIEYDNRYKAVIQLITNLNKYAQKETAPRTIARRKKLKKESE